MMPIEEFLQRAWGWAKRRYPRLPIVSVFEHVRRSRALGSKAHAWAPFITGDRMARRQWRRTARSASHRFLHRGNPSPAARSALILGQIARMLKTADKVLAHYRTDVLAGDPLPPLELVKGIERQVFQVEPDDLGYLRLAVELAPNYAEAWCELGRVLLEDGRPDEALVALRMVPLSASYADPDRQPENIYNIVNGVKVKAWYWMGQAHECRGDENLAILAYLEALVLHPNCAIVSRALADLQYRRGALSASLEYWEYAMGYLPLVVALPRVGRDLRDLPRVIDEHLARMTVATRSRQQGAQ